MGILPGDRRFRRGNRVVGDRPVLPGSHRQAAIDCSITPSFSNSSQRTSAGRNFADSAANQPLAECEFTLFFVIGFRAHTRSGY